MARKPRIDAPGGWYLISNRGARRQDVFIDDCDRANFLAQLVESTSRFGVQIVAFVLMGNHYHRVLHCPDGHLSATIQHFASNYVRWFNKRHGFDGPQCRARFDSRLLRDDNHLAAATRYVHRNAIELGRDIATDPWCSFAMYIGLRPTPDWLRTELPIRLSGGRQRYRRFVEANWISDDLMFHDASNPAGSQFTDRVAALLDALDNEVARAAGVELASLYEPSSGAGNPARDVASLLATDRTPLTPDDVAQRYGFQLRHSLNAAVRRARARVEDSAVTRTLNSQPALPSAPYPLPRAS